MDGSAQAFSSAIASQAIAESWLYWVVLGLVCFVATFFASYVRKRAENLATRDDFNELKRQVTETTRLTEDIKREIGHAEWKTREVNSILRSKLEELVREASKCDQTLATYVQTMTGGKYLPTSTVETASLIAITDLYFPSLNEAVSGYTANCRATIVWAIERCQAVEVARQAKAGQAAIDVILLETREQYRRMYPESIRLRTVLEGQAAEFMQTLLALPDAVSPAVRA